MKPSFSVLIPDGESTYAMLVLHSLAQFSNVKVHFLSTDSFSPARFSRYTHGYTFSHAWDESDLALDTILKVVRKEKIDVLLPVDKNGITFSIANHQALSNFVKVAPLPDQKTFNMANNKWLLSQFLEESQMPGPLSVLVKHDDLFEKRLQELQFPVLLKPTDLGGGRGIVHFENLSDLREYLKYLDPNKFLGQFLVQSIIVGDEVTFNILARKGNILAANFQKGLIQNEKYAPMGAVEFIKDDKLIKTAQNFASRLGWNGWACLDSIRDSNGDLRITDMNARFWNSLLGSTEAGISFPYLACLEALGIEFPAPDYELIRYFHPMTFLRERLLNVSDITSKHNITFRESGLKYLLYDPLAEGLRIYYNNR